MFTTAMHLPELPVGRPQKRTAFLGKVPCTQARPHSRRSFGPSCTYSPESFATSEIYFRSGTQYWTTNVITVVRAAAAVTGSVVFVHFFNSGISKVTADAARTPALTLAVGAQLVVAAGVVGGFCDPSCVRAGAGADIFFLLFKEVCGKPVTVYHS